MRTELVKKCQVTGKQQNFLCQAHGQPCGLVTKIVCVGNPEPECDDLADPSLCGCVVRYPADILPSVESYSMYENSPNRCYSQRVDITDLIQVCV